MAAEFNAPGFFALGLEAAEAATDSKELRLRIRRLKHWLPNLPQLHRTSVINLIGTLQYYAGEKYEAIQSFNDVLKEDSENVNALANLEAVYRSLPYTATANDYRKKLRYFWHDASSASPEGVGRQARCLAEQGHALGFEKAVNREDVSKKAYSYYERALLLGRDTFSSSDRISCRFNMALLKSRELLKRKFECSVPDGYNEVLGLFKNILLDPEAQIYHAEAWCDVGKLCTQAVNHDRQEEMTINLRDVQYNATQCFEEAVKLRPRDSDIRIAYGRWLCQTDQFEAALKQLNICLEVDPSEDNWYAYVSRARTILKAVKAKRMLPDRLHDAFNDQQKVVEWQYSSKSLQTLGQICHRLASGAGDRRDEFRTRALQYLEQATRCEGGSQDPVNYALQGDCLRDLGELEAALDKYKAVIVHEPESRLSRYNNFTNVLRTGFEIKRRRGGNVLDPVMANMKTYYDKMCKECSEANVTNALKYLRSKGYNSELDQLRG